MTKLIVDWTKPIQFANGEPCEYDGVASNFPDNPRVVRRIGVEGEAGTWFYPDDGQCKEHSMSKAMGYDIINIKGDL